jgi:integrase
VTDTFNAVRVELEIQKKPEEAIKFQAFSAHWLRHTGASLEVERGRPLKDLSEDLGHSTMATTDRTYVHSDVLKRAKSGAGRKVGKQN